MTNAQEKRIREEGWPCACVRRNRHGALKAIKLNAPELERCRVCGATKAEVEKIQTEDK